MRALLDCSALIALVDSSHNHHRDVRAWFAAHHTDGWATCAITQNACIRVMSQKSYPHPAPAKDVAIALQFASASPEHEFWTDDICLYDPALFNLDSVSAKDTTDIYLLGLAISNGGCLVSFDKGMLTSAVLGFRPENLVLL